MPRQPWDFWLELPQSLETDVMTRQLGVMDRLATWGHDHRPAELEDDFVQAALAAAASSVDNLALLKPIRSLRAWLAAKTRSLVLNEANRKEREFVAHQAAGRTTEWTVQGPLTALLLAERDAIIRRLIDDLGPRRQAVIRGRMADLDDGEIAASVLGHDDPQARALVRKLFERGCDDLRVRLEGIDLTC